VSSTSTERPVRAALVLLAAGSGSRVGDDVNKVFLPLAGRPVLAWSLRWARQVASIECTVLLVAERDVQLATRTLLEEAPDAEVEVVVGGATRHESEFRALAALADRIRAGRVDVVVIHDAARPLADSDLCRSVIAEAARHGGAVPVRPQPGLIPADGHDRGEMATTVVAVQTPQAFRAGSLLTAYEEAQEVGFVGTDTASCVERFTTETVRCVPSSARNVKITYRDDLLVAAHLLARASGDLDSDSGRV